MATSSLYEDLVLDTPESIAAMEEAFRRADVLARAVPYKKVGLCTDREFLDRFMKGTEGQV